MSAAGEASLPSRTGISKKPRSTCKHVSWAFLLIPVCRSKTNNKRVRDLNEQRTDYDLSKRLRLIPDIRKASAIANAVAVIIFIASDIISPHHCLELLG